MILKSETYHFYRLDLTRQAGFIVTIYDYCGDRWTQPVGLCILLWRFITFLLGLGPHEALAHD